ncbi:sodium bicarbonate transporter 11 isoform X2 [Octopus vulgaris]|uniref:Sodium bicarbonate transporter 11 isoform X2 n=2 Tax=Octopus vulgaris TaxID=6645 RepID=A0AA36BDK2_OCTVU|nr:sodium bicarbonate transporter 11 isoform X2 [Octopus vulgaris]
MSGKDKNGWKPSVSDGTSTEETTVYLKNFSFLEEDNPAFLPDETFSNGLGSSEQTTTCELKPEIVDTKDTSIGSDEKDIAERSLIYSRHEKVPMKDFSKEIRGAKDIERFANRAILLLNMNVTNVDKIIEEILKAMVHINDIPALKSLLFTHDGVHQLRKTVQSSCIAMGGGFDYDQSWICSMCCSPLVTKTMVGIAHLHHPANFGTTAQEISFVIIIITPTKEKGTKSEFEIGRTFGTLFSCPDLRQELSQCSSAAQFNNVLRKYAEILAEQNRKSQMYQETEQKEVCKCGFMRGLRKDLKRRLPHYISDYKDGVVGPRSVQKTLSTTLFLYFAILLPSIAFGVLNNVNTGGKLNVETVIYSQIFGGLVFALFGGTPQIVLLTTAPLALYTKIIYSICKDFDIDFAAMFGCVGLWNTFFLFIYSFFDLSILMQWSTRSSEEIFALFIAIAFTVDSFKSLALRVSLFNFKNTPYLTSAKREMFSDYALPASVIIMSFVGAYLFRDIKLGESFDPDTTNATLELVPFSKLNVGSIFGGMGLGFCLSLLFFMDQNISAALVNAPQNKMKKGTAYHWDLFVVGVINGILSIFAFPWLHAALPHSPLHVLALADVEERVDQGHVYRTIVHVRETRLTAIFSHILIGLSVLILNYLAYIPNPVLYGLFLFVAVTSLYDNQMFERFCLLFTEQSAYPPNHFIRQVPQRKMHLFTGLQVLQLVILCIFGFAPYPYLKMFFPVLIFGLIPARHKIIPYIINDKFLKAMDGN